MKFKGKDIEPYECFCVNDSGEFNKGQLGGVSQRR